MVSGIINPGLTRDPFLRERVYGAAERISAALFHTRILQYDWGVTRVRHSVKALGQSA